MAENQFEVIKRDLTQSNPAQGEILALVLSELTPQQFEGLRLKAAEGKMALELEQLRKVHVFQASSADLNEFIENVRRLESSQRNHLSSYKATGTFTTATGTTTIVAKKGCFVATVIYENADHPNVILLRRFRDEVLEKHVLGEWLSRFYGCVGPHLASSSLSRGRNKIVLKTFLNAICGTVRWIYFKKRYNHEDSKS